MMGLQAALCILTTAAGAALLGEPSWLFAVLGLGAGWLLRRRRAAAIAGAVGLGALTVIFAPQLLGAVRASLLALAAGQSLPAEGIHIWAGLCAGFLSMWMAGSRVGAPALCLLLLPGFWSENRGAVFGMYLLGLGLCFFPAYLYGRHRRWLRFSLRIAPLLMLAAACLTLAPMQAGAGLRRELLTGSGGIVQELFPGEVPVTAAEETVNLRQPPPPDGKAKEVMELTANRGGVYYLRGRDYDSYTGTGWVSTERREEFGGWGEVTDEISIRISGYENQLYLPYYPARAVDLRAGLAAGTLRDYRFAVCDRGLAAPHNRMGPFLRLPEETLHWGRQLLGNAGTPEAISDLVRQTAPYDRKTPAMPEDAEDFVRWFAETAESGYCVHFASLCTVLLRCAGIPARYVTGYRVEAQPGQTVTVTREQAHAWAEFYDWEEGTWRVLESTPAEERLISDSWEIPAEVVKTVIKVLAFSSLLVVYLQSRLRLLLRLLGCRRGTARLRAQRLYDRGAGLAKLLQEQPPEYLNELLQKCLYGPETPQERELETFRVYCRQCLRRMRKSGFWNRLRYRLIFAAY